MDSPLEFARWLTGGVGPDGLVPDAVEYWTRAIERRDAAVRSAPREEGDAAGEALETAWMQYSFSLRAHPNHIVREIGDEPEPPEIFRAGYDAGAAARAPGPAGGEALEVAMPLLKGGGHPEERVPEYSAVEEPDVVVAALLDIIRIARTLAVSTGVVVTLDQTRIELNVIVDRAANALAAARAPGPIDGLSAEVRAEVIAALQEVRRHVYEEPMSEKHLMEVTGPALQHALGILDGVTNEAAPSPEPSA